MGSDPTLFKYAKEIIRYKARQLARKPGFSPSDQEDIEQDLFAAIVGGWPAFDSSRASARTFIARIIENKAKSIVRACRAAKRDGRRCTPLNGDGENGARDFEEREDRHRSGSHARSAIESLSLCLDVASVVAELPEELRRLCQQLLHESVSDAARSLGRHRTSLYRDICELRKRFIDAGLREYR